MPIWRFLRQVLPRRWERLKDELKRDIHREFRDPRGEAEEVGLVFAATIDTTGDEAG
jgi:hypothetical protein